MNDWPSWVKTDQWVTFRFCSWPHFCNEHWQFDCDSNPRLLGNVAALEGHCKSGHNAGKRRVCLDYSGWGWGRAALRRQITNRYIFRCLLRTLGHVSLPGLCRKNPFTPLLSHGEKSSLTCKHAAIVTTKTHKSIPWDPHPPTPQTGSQGP